jgi:hypothetical protein
MDESGGAGVKGVKSPAPPVEPCFHKDDLFRQAVTAVGPASGEALAASGACPQRFRFVLSLLAKKLRFVAMFSEEIASKPAPLNRPLA